MSTTCIQFPNVTGHTQYGYTTTTSLADNLTDFSISIWVRVNNPELATLNSDIITKASNGDGSNGWRIQQYPISTNVCGVTFSILNTYTVTNITDIGDGLWHNIVAVKNSSSTKLLLYVDNGIPITVSCPASLSYSNSDSVAIGNYPTSPNSNYRGEMCAIGIWDRALTSLEIVALQTSYPSVVSSSIAEWDFTDGSGVIAADQSGNGNPLNLVGLSWATDGPPLSPTLYLNLSDSILLADSLSPSFNISQNLSDSVIVSDSTPGSFSIQSDFLVPVHIPIVEQLVNQLVPANIKTYFKIVE